MRNILATLAFFAMLVAAPLIAQEPVTFTLKEKGAPTIHAKEVKNGVVFEEYKGKVVLLNFFGKNCKYCMKEIPDLVDLQNRYKDKFQVVAIHVQEMMTPGERSRLESRFKFNYPIYEVDNNYNFFSYIAQRAGYTGSIPFTIIFDKSGSAAKIIPGYAPKDMLEHIVKVLTSQPLHASKEGSSR